MAVAIEQQYQLQPETYSLGIWLEGELGTGKTTLVRGLLKKLGVVERVKSPTYALIESYKTDKSDVLATLPLVHMDLYRLSEAEELEYIGVPEILDASLVLVEWPGQGQGWLPPADMIIFLEDHIDGRRINLKAKSSRGQELLDNID